MTQPTTQRRTTAADRRVLRLGALLGGSGLLHLVAPGPYERIVPPGLGDKRRIVILSGLAELGCAALLAAPATRRLGALASAGLFVGVFPANVYSIKAVGPSRLMRAGAIARLPLQVPMIRTAMKVAADSR